MIDIYMSAAEAVLRHASLYKQPFTEEDALIRDAMLKAEGHGGEEIVDYLTNLYRTHPGYEAFRITLRHLDKPFEVSLACLVFVLALTRRKQEVPFWVALLSHVHEKKKDVVFVRDLLDIFPAGTPRPEEIALAVSLYVAQPISLTH